MLSDEVLSIVTLSRDTLARFVTRMAFSSVPVEEMLSLEIEVSSLYVFTAS